MDLCINTVEDPSNALTACLLGLAVVDASLAARDAHLR